MLVQQYWELLRPFASSFKVGATRKISLKYGNSVRAH